MDNIDRNDEEIADPIVEAKEMQIEQSLTESSDKPPEYQKLQIKVSARELLSLNFQHRAHSSIQFAFMLPYISK